MAITENDFMEIFTRHGLNRELALKSYESYSKTRNSVANMNLGPGVDDATAKKDIDLLAAMIARGQSASGNQGAPPKKRGFFSRLFGK